MDAGDPFDWTVDKVVEELCHKPTLPGQEVQSVARPDRATLETTLRENDVGGQVLLEDVNKSVLKEDFNIKSLGQRSALERAIRFLQAQSTKWSDKGQGTPSRFIEGYNPITPYSQPPHPSFSPRTTYGFSGYRSPLQSYNPFDHTTTPSDRDGRPAVPLFKSSRNEPGGTDLADHGGLPREEALSSDQQLHDTFRQAHAQTITEIDPLIVPSKRHRTSIGQEGFDSSIVPSIEPKERNNQVRAKDGGAVAGNPKHNHVVTDYGKRRRIAPTLVEAYHDDRYYSKSGVILEDVFYGVDTKDDTDTWTSIGSGVNPGTQQYVSGLMKHFLQQPVETVQGSTAQARIPYTENRVRCLQSKRHRRQMFTLFPSNESPVILNAANWPSLELRGFGPFGRKARRIGYTKQYARSHSNSPDYFGSVSGLDEYDQLLERYPPKDEDEDIEVSMAHSVGSLDDETWRELQEEQQENVRSMKALLSAEKIAAVIQDYISTMMTSWREHKLNRIERKAFALWRRATQLGGRAIEIDAAEKRLVHIEQSLAKVTKEIMSHQWSKVDELQSLCQVLEPYISQREEQRQILMTLRNDHCPPRPVPRQPRAKKTQITDLKDGEEILDSESAPTSQADDLSDFLEDDTPANPLIPYREHTPLEYSESEKLHDSFGRRNKEESDVDLDRLEEVLNINMGDEADTTYAFADDEGEAGNASDYMPNVPIASTSKVRATLKKRSNMPFLSDSNEEFETAAEDNAYNEYSNTNPQGRPSKGESRLPESKPNPPFTPPSKYTSKGYNRENAIALSSDGPEPAPNSNSEVQTPVLSPTTPNIVRRKNLNDTDEAAFSAGQPKKLSKVRKSTYDEAAHSRLSKLAKERQEGYDGRSEDLPSRRHDDANARRELQDIEKIRQLPFEHLERTYDPKRLLAKIVYEDRPHAINRLRKFMAQNDKHYLGAIIEEGLKDLLGLQNDIRGEEKVKTARRLAKYYASYANCRNIVDSSHIPPKHLQRMLETAQQPDDYTVFFDTLRTILNARSKSESEKRFPSQSDHASLLFSRGKRKDSYSRDPLERESSLGEAEDEFEHSMVSGTNLTPHKKRVRKVAESQDALAAQRSDRLRIQKQEFQKKIVQSKVGSFNNATDNASTHIIGYDDPLTYLEPSISERVKPHQVEGISFMWREIIGDDKGQGCLLAHTMGLGKTMQVISLLVTIVLSKHSSDPEVRKQVSVIPNSRTLILCPPSLIENWLDEFIKWVPEDVWVKLGDCYKITSSLKPQERVQYIHDWYVEGGILIISYDLLRTVIQNTPARAKGISPLSEELHERTKRELWDGPSIVVADEAHKMKNDSSALSKVTSQFTTTRRIALTGSPLANNLGEYYAMINWIAPGYLGSFTQFKAKYIEPIEEGLYTESTPTEQRRSLKRLQILKEDLNPKVCRADITAIKQDLPQKTEFYITLSLTKLQLKAYELYVNAILKDASRAGNARLWDWLFVLSLLCNHPSCFHQKISERSTDRAAPRRQGPSTTDDPEGDSLPTDVAVKDLHISTDTLEKQLVPLDEEADLTDPMHSARTDILLRLIESCLEIKDKVLIFSHSIPTLDYLDRLFKAENYNFCRLDGSTKMESRQNATKQFNQEDGRFDIFLISTRAGGLGFNLPGANRVVIFDFGFNPQWEEQAIGRAYRLGQTKPVFVYRFCSAGTFEPIVQNKTIFKTSLSARVVDKKNPMRAASKKVTDYVFSPKEEARQNLQEVLGKDPDVLDPLISHKAIKSIVLTETFQKELDETLTVEEQKEVQQEIQDEKLKRDNPRAFEAVLAKRNRVRPAPLPQNVSQRVELSLERLNELTLDPLTRQELELRKLEAAVRNNNYQNIQAPSHPGASAQFPQHTSSHYTLNRQPSPPLNGAGRAIGPMRASSQGPQLS